MKASEFALRSFPFYEFNPVQAAAIPHACRDVNLVVSSPTATGKTVVAECLFAHHLQGDCKVAYVSPLRSLALQKQNEWEKDPQFGPCRVVASTGDHAATADDLENGRILLLTSESFDSKTRKPANATWLNQVACLVIDEAHTIGDPGRGDKLEAAMMRFTAINPNARLCLLSATMKNADAIASWVKSLNGKDTVKVVSRWRPNKLTLNVHEVDENGYDGWMQQINIAVDLATNRSAGEKVIVFVHSKRTGQEIRKKLKEAMVPSAFHNASLQAGKKRQIEEAFNSSISGMDVLVSTSTLAAGVNL